MTQTCPSSVSLDTFLIAFRAIRQSWLNSPDDDADISNELMGDLIDEIEDFLNDYGSMGN